MAGGYPAIFDRGLDAAEWHSPYVATYIERDVRTISNVGDLAVSYFRDRNGAEVDLVVEGPDAAVLVEAEATATPSSSLLASAGRVRNHLADSHPATDVVCVYGGDMPQQRSDGLLVPWHRLHHTVGRLLA